MSARAAAAESEFPVIDLAGALDGGPAAARVAAEFHQALEGLGFLAVINHGVAAETVDGVFAQAERFHRLPREAKLGLRFAESYAGYLPGGQYSIRTSTVNANDKPDLNDAYFVERDAPPADAEAAAARAFRSPNKWPDGLPGFREAVLDYYRAVEGLAHKLLPLYARALELAPGHFRPAFRWPQAALRLTHYPPLRRQANQFGIAPHTDANFCTVLATRGAPGLHVQTSAGRWLEVPEVPGGFVVNAGDMMRRWSNDRLRSTRHMAVNDTANHRYAAVFFFAPNLDYEIACLPSCTGPDNPPKYPPITYRDYRRWFMDANYRTGLDRPLGQATP